MKIEIQPTGLGPNVGVYELYEGTTILGMAYEEDLYDILFSEGQIKKREEGEYEFNVSQKKVMDCMIPYRMRLSSI